MKWSIALVLVLSAFAGSVKNEEVLKRNPALKTLLPHWRGNPYRGGEFLPFDSSAGEKNLWDILKWKFSKNPKAEAVKKDNFHLQVEALDKLPADEGDAIVWLGHASFLFRLNGIQILTDPCFFDMPFFPRLAPMPMDPEKLKPDLLLVSHSHRDHLDGKSVEGLEGDTIHALVPLEMGKLLQGMNPKIRFVEAGWYQIFEAVNGVEVILLPAAHWSRRGLADKNEILWASYLIRTKTVTVYFAGDTGYSTHFAEIGKMFPGIDCALLPIGAYDPAFIMRGNHMDPEEALRAFEDLGARTLIPMHYGTYSLTDEPLGEPVERIRRAFSAGQIENRLNILHPGEIFTFEKAVISE